MSSTGGGTLALKVARASYTSPALLSDNVAEWKKRLLRRLESNAVSAVMMLATFFALYGVDFHIVSLAPKTADVGLYAVVMICFILFIIEFVVSCVCRVVPGKRFIGSFFFYLDILAIVSLLPDVLMLFDIDLMNLAAPGTSDGAQHASTASIARAGRAARVSARAARIVRILKLITLVRNARSQRVDKKRASIIRPGGSNSREKEEATSQMEMAAAEVGSSLVGRVLTDRITYKVITMLGCILITSGLLTLLEEDSNVAAVTMLSQLEAVKGSATDNATFPSLVAEFAVSLNTRVAHKPVWADDWDTYWDDIKANCGAQPSRDCLVWTSVRRCRSDCEGVCSLGCRAFWGFDPSAGYSPRCRKFSLRSLSISGVSMWCGSCTLLETLGQLPRNECIADLRSVPREYTILQTDDSQLVMETQEIAVGQSVASAIQITFIILLLSFSSYLFSNDTDTLVVQPLEKMMKFVRLLNDNPFADVSKSKRQEEYETDFVENALRKLAKLLQISFGEAGKPIIGANLGSAGAVDPMVPGRLMYGIFGFWCVVLHARDEVTLTPRCDSDIRNFTDCTECLQQDVMVFVNSIGDIVHRASTRHYGAPNKNIGDAFLLAWRFPDGYKPEEKLSRTRDTKTAILGDEALKSFVATIWECSTSLELQYMTDDPKIQDRMPGYSVRMGFGLHFGWAIEGAIGSRHKIDASYLSPNVNMASRLEAATKQFGTAILMSGAFYELLSDKVKGLCRRIDRVTVKGSNEPLDLYTYDVEVPEGCTPEQALEDSSHGDFWEQFRPWTSAKQREAFKEGVDLYVDGKWPEAVRIIQQYLNDLGRKDVPAQNLLDIMSNAGGVAPASWEGFRPLTEK